jgi:hypothetical protein
MPPIYERVYPTFDSVVDATFDLLALVEQLVVFLRSAEVCPQTRPEVKAGSLYLAIVEAFERCGMLAREHAPDLLLDIEGRQYEVQAVFLRCVRLTLYSRRA